MISYPFYFPISDQLAFLVRQVGFAIKPPYFHDSSEFDPIMVYDFFRKHGCWELLVKGNRLASVESMVQSSYIELPSVIHKMDSGTQVGVVFTEGGCAYVSKFLLGYLFAAEPFWRKHSFCVFTAGENDPSNLIYHTYNECHKKRTLNEDQEKQITNDFWLSIEGQMEDVISRSPSENVSDKFYGRSAKTHLKNFRERFANLIELSDYLVLCPLMKSYKDGEGKKITVPPQLLDKFGSTVGGFGCFEFQNDKSDQLVNKKVDHDYEDDSSEAESDFEDAKDPESYCSSTSSDEAYDGLVLDKNGYEEESNEDEETQSDDEEEEIEWTEDMEADSNDKPDDESDDESDGGEEDDNNGDERDDNSGDERDEPRLGPGEAQLQAEDDDSEVAVVHAIPDYDAVGFI